MPLSYYILLSILLYLIILNFIVMKPQILYWIT